MNHYVLDTLIYHFEAAMQALPLNEQLPHTLHSYKEIDQSTGERADLKRPFIYIGPARSVNQGQPKANSFQQPFRDITNARIYIETELTFREGGKTKGGFDERHQPAINFTANFITANRILLVPAELLTAFGGTQVALNPGIPFEDHVPLKDGERSMFSAVLSFYTTTNDGSETS